jgi:hypothetical protein
MNVRTLEFVRRPRAWLVVASTGLLALPFTVPSAGAQTVTGGDFDICDYCGNVSGNIVRLRGRAGFGTEARSFVLYNAASSDQDVDGDGFTAGVHFTNLFISNVTDFENVADPSRIIERSNFVLGDALNPLQNGFQNSVRVSVRIPAGTPAGVYFGTVQIRDSVRLPGVNPNGELLRIDTYGIEIEVQPTFAAELVRADTNARLDSLRIAGRSGQTARGVLRIANIGNVNLSNVRLEATDLVATSGTGLRIRSERISFSPEVLPSLAGRLASFATHPIYSVRGNTWGSRLRNKPGERPQQRSGGHHLQR